MLVALTDDDSREQAVSVATALRRRGIACEVAPAAARFGKQIRYAERRGIPYVWFPGAGERATRSRNPQRRAGAGLRRRLDAAAEDLAPVVTRTDAGS